MKTMERVLCDDRLGLAVIDALVQANVDLQSVSLEQAKQLLVSAARQQRRGAAPMWQNLPK